MFGDDFEFQNPELASLRGRPERPDRTRYLDEETLAPREGSYYVNVYGRASKRPFGKYINRQEWYRNGYLHREGGPAIEFSDGTKFWYRDGEPHREDGPARESPDGRKEWWLKGEQVKRDEISQRTPPSQPASFKV